MSTSLPDAGIPVLTEIIPTHQESPADRGAAPPAEASADAAPSATEEKAGLPLDQQAAREWDEESWDRLEREVRGRVLYHVLQRIDVALEDRVRDSLADVLQTAVETLASEIRTGLHQTIKEVVTRAVSQEIANLQVLKK
ncbi:MAG: hypothetical protein JWR25_747 [Noviherbaspirillum sp.]|nr:hypothetical protein [Noviherbaspirillum sp.]